MCIATLTIKEHGQLVTFNGNTTPILLIETEDRLEHLLLLLLLVCQELVIVVIITLLLSRPSVRSTHNRTIQNAYITSHSMKWIKWLLLTLLYKIKEAPLLSLILLLCSMSLLRS